MTFETMKEGASLFQCKLTDEGDSVSFEFPKVTMKIAKDFKTGETEDVLFVLKGWLELLKEVLENEAREPQQAK
jgi:hypothetical protein